MSNTLVQILVDDDGNEPNHPEDWHLTDPCNWQGAATLCTGEFYGVGESVCVYKEKQVVRGGITCANCLKMIKKYKSIKL